MRKIFQILKKFMNVSIRHGELLDLLELRQKLTIPEIIEAFNISPATARRDCIVLSESGKAKKIRNGVMSLNVQPHKLSGNGNVDWDPEHEESIQNLEEKNRIAAQAVALTKSEGSCIINSGSTAFLVGKKLCGSVMQIISNYFPLLNYLIEQRHPKIYVMGGEYYSERELLLNATIDDHKYEADYLFTSGSGLTEDGLYKTDMVSAMAEQKLLNGTSLLVALVDSTKVGTRQGALAIKATNIDIVITGKGANPQVIQSLKDKGIQVHLV